MADHEFKNWLTFEEAAAWLSSKTSKEYTANAITRAVMKGRLPAYYWPSDGAEIGLFTNLKPLPPGYESWQPLAHGGNFLNDYQSPPFCIYEGPVPIVDYEGFKRSASLSSPWPVGLTVQEGGVVIGGCYRIGTNDEPVSMAAADYLELIHIEHLEQFLSDPNTPHSAPDTRIDRITLGDQSIWLASCAVPAGGSIDVEADQPPATDERPESKTGQPPATDEQPESEAPALKALAFAAHLIANLADRLDETEPVASRRLGMKKAGKPVVSRIAAQLARTAEALNHTGHGYGAKGFQANLKRALDAISAPDLE